MNRQIDKVFPFEGAAVRVLGTPEKPLFVVEDLRRALELASRTHDLLARHPEEEKVMKSVDTGFGHKEIWAVNESGLYRLIFKSDKPNAEKFRRWVFREVLPAIRKTGAYSVSGDPIDNLMAWLATPEGFQSAKSGGAQAKIIQFMQSERRRQADSQAKESAGDDGSGADLLSLDEFWQYVVDLFGGRPAGDLIYFFKVISEEVPAPPNAPGQNGGWLSCRLYMEPVGVHEVVRRSAFKDGKRVPDRKRLAEMMRREPYWVPPRNGSDGHRQRLGPGKAPRRCWCVNVDLHPFGYEPVEDEAVAQLESGEPDPRRGPLFNIIEKVK